MNKRAKVTFVYLFAFAIVSTIFLAYFALAGHVVRIDEVDVIKYVLEDQSYIFNISINNTDAGSDANITNITILLPSSFIFNGVPNGTDAVADFSYSSYVLSWINTTDYILNGSENKSFWFNATPSTPGTYNISINILNSSGFFNNNITVIVNDTTAPSVSVSLPANTTYGTQTINFNITTNENSTCLIELGNINYTMSQHNTTSYNFTNATVLADGAYSVRFRCNDSANNANETTTRAFTIDTTNPLLTLVAPTNITYNSATRTINFTYTESNCDSVWYNNGTGNSSRQNCNLNWTGITALEGSNTWTLYMNDTINHVNSSTVTFTVDTTAPSVSVSLPANTTYGTQTINFNITTNENISTCKLQLSNVNYTMTRYNDTSFNHTNVTADGSYSAIFWCNDTMNNINGTTTRSFTVDTTNPLLTLVAPTNITYNSATRTINFTYTESNCDSVWYNNGTGNSSRQNCNLNWTGITALEGSNTWTLYMNDTINHVNSSTVTFTVDTTAPSVSVSLPANTTYGTQTINFNITTNENSTCLVELGNINYTMSRHNTTSYNLTNITADGSYTARFRCNDSANNVNATTTISFTVDTTNPLLTLVAPTNTTYNSATRTINFTYTESNCDSVWYNNGTGNSSRQNCNLNWTGITALEGSNTWTLYMNDTLNHVNYSTVTFTVDLGVPSVSVSLPANTTYGTQTINFNITTSENSTCLIELGNTNYTMSQHNTTSYNFTNATVLADGAYSARFRCNDSANNVDATTTIAFTVDTTNPLLTLVSPTNTTYNSATRTINFTYTESNCDSVWYNNGTGNSSRQNCNLNWTGITALEGSNTWTLYMNDTVNHVNYSTVTFRIDTAGPNNVSFNNSDLTRNYSQSFIYINVIASDATSSVDTIKIVLYNSTWGINATNSTNVSTYAINYTGLSNGVYRINLTVNDTQNNINITTYSILLDTVAPNSIVLNAPANAVSATTTAYNFTFNVSDTYGLANCSLILDGAIVASSSEIRTSGENGIYHSGIAVGSHTWSINCTDNSGNTNSSNSSRTLTVTAASSTVSPGTGSGGTQLLTASETQLQAGYTKTLFNYGSIKFTSSGASHSMKLKKIFNKTATIEVSSTPQTAILSEGEIRKFDLDADGTDDISVKLNSVKSTVSADFTIQNLAAATPLTTPDTTPSTTPQTTPDTTPQTTPETTPVDQQTDTAPIEPVKKSGAVQWIFALIVLIVIAVVVILVLRGNKQNRRKKLFEFSSF